MNRWVTSSIAFSIGLGGSFVAFTSNESTLNAVNQGAKLGPATVTSYCQERFGSTGFGVLPLLPTGRWSCTSAVNGLFNTVDVDLDDVCAQKYGKPAYAAVFDASTPFGWDCRRGQSPAPG